MALREQSEIMAAFYILVMFAVTQIVEGLLVLQNARSQGWVKVFAWTGLVNIITTALIMVGLSRSFKKIR